MLPPKSQLNWPKRFRFLVLVILFLASAGASARPQQSTKPLSKNQVRELVKAGMDSGELAQKVKQLGIDFDLTDDYIQELRNDGAKDVLISALRAARPKALTRDQVLQLVAGHVPSQRAAALVEQHGIDFVPDEDYLETLRVAGAEDVLLDALRTAGKAVTTQVDIETSPHAEVYLDDQLAGKVGDDGRFAAKLKPGAHSLRVTLTGKKDYQQSLSLVAGQESRVNATLADIEKSASPGSLVLLVEDTPRCGMCRAGGVTSWMSDFSSQLPQGVWVAVVTFNMRTQIILDFTLDTKTVPQALARLQGSSFQESNLFDALAFTADRIKTIRGKKSILVIATGLDTFSKLAYDSTLDHLQQAGVPVFGVELRDSSIVTTPGENVLRRIARTTGGKVWIAQSENMMPDLHEVVAALGNGPQQ